MLTMQSETTDPPMLKVVQWEWEEHLNTVKMIGHFLDFDRWMCLGCHGSIEEDCAKKQPAADWETASSRKTQRASQTNVVVHEIG